MPFVDPDAQGFFCPAPAGDAETYAACLQGVAFVERWCYEVMESLGCRADGPVYTSGAGARNPVWNRLRATVLGRRLCLPRMSDPAVGAAILAARGLSVPNAIRNMVAIREEFEPDGRLAGRYEALYRRFRAACAERGLGRE